MFCSAARLTQAPIEFGLDDIHWRRNIKASRSQTHTKQMYRDGRGTTIFTRPYEPVFSSDISEETANTHAFRDDERISAAAARAFCRGKLKFKDIAWHARHEGQY